MYNPIKCTDEELEAIARATKDITALADERGAALAEIDRRVAVVAWHNAMVDRWRARSQAAVKGWVRRKRHAGGDR